MEPFFPLSALLLPTQYYVVRLQRFWSLLFTATLELDASAWISSIAQRAAFAIDGIASTALR